jgi:hypothetical protein
VQITGGIIGITQLFIQPRCAIGLAGGPTSMA